MLNRRTGATLTALAATAVLLAACGGSSSSSSTSASPTISVASVGASAALLPQEYKDKGEINVASIIPYPPTSILADDGTVSGLDYDLSQALGQQLGIKVSFNMQAFDSIITSVQAGEHDIIMSALNDTLERQQILDFVDYFLAGYSILVAKGNPESITSIKDLCGKAVSELAASAQIALIKAAAKQCPAGQTIEVIALPTDVEAQNAVRSGKASAYLMDAAAAVYSATTEPDVFEVVVDPNEPNGIAPVYTGIGILKANSGLTTALQAAMQELIDNGTYAEIFNKYGLGQYVVPSAQINAATS